MPTVNYDIQPIFAGATCAAKEFALVDDTLAAINLTGYDVQMFFTLIQVKGVTNPQAPEFLTIGAGLTVTSMAGGTVELDAQVIAWQPGTYRYTLVLVDPSSVRTIKVTGSWVIWYPLAENIIPPLDEGPPGTPGAAGAPGATIHSGVGAPSSALGANGDYYIDTANGDLYQKTAGTWAVIMNITGPTGPPGPSGTSIKVDMAGALVTGTLVETKLASIAFVAGDVLALDTDEIIAWMGKLLSNGAATIRMYLNDTNDLTTATQIATYSVTATLRTLPFRRTMQNITNASQRIFGSASSGINDLDTSTVNRSSLTFNRNTTHYLIVSAQLANALDTVFIDSFTCETKRP